MTLFADVRNFKHIIEENQEIRNTFEDIHELKAVLAPWLQDELEELG